MINFYVLLQIGFLTTTNKEVIKELLDEISKCLDSNTYLFDRGDYFIVKYLNKLDVSSDEILYNKIFYFYNKLKDETKTKIEKYSQEINTYVKAKKRLEEKIGLLIKKECSIDELYHVNYVIEEILEKVANNAGCFFEELIQNENTVTRRLKYLHLNKKERQEYDEKIKTLKEEAAKRLEGIDQTWKSITETEGIEDEKFKMKQKILLNTQENWDLFRNAFCRIWVLI